MRPSITRVVIFSSLQTPIVSTPPSLSLSLSKHGTDLSTWLSFDEIRTATSLALNGTQCASCCYALTLARSWRLPHTHGNPILAPAAHLSWYSRWVCCSFFHVHQPRPSSSCSLSRHHASRSFCPQAGQGVGREGEERM